MARTTVVPAGRDCFVHCCVLGPWPRARRSIQLVPNLCVLGSCLNEQRLKERQFLSLFSTSPASTAFSHRRLLPTPEITGA